MPFLHPQAMCQIFANIFFGTHSNQTLSPNPPEPHQNASKLSAGMMHGSTPFPLRVNPLPVNSCGVTATTYFFYDNQMCDPDCAIKL